MGIKLSDEFSNLRSMNVKRIFYEFSKPIFNNIFFKNKEGLINSSNKIDFNKIEWNINPMKFCQDIYNEQYFYPIILLCNDIGSIYEFIPEKLNNIIIAPQDNIIYNIFTFDKD